MFKGKTGIKLPSGFLDMLLTYGYINVYVYTFLKMLIVKKSPFWKKINNSIFIALHSFSWSRSSTIGSSKRKMYPVVLK